MTNDAAVGEGGQVPHEVFISYASADKDAADAVCDVLESEGLRCWIAPRDVPVGARYAEAIVEAIHTARVLLLVFSEAANASVHVERELDRAVSGGLALVPLRLEEREPSGALEYYLAGRQWFNAPGPAPTSDRLEPLCRAVAALLAYPGTEQRADTVTSAHPVALRQERRVVTTLICDLVGFTALCETADPEDVDAMLAAYHDCARRVIGSHGGAVEKFIGDAIVGVFGVPGIHEDDPERAVRAGLRLIETLQGMTRPDGSPLQARVGINTGEALVRLDVDPASGRGFVTGDAANVAARLQAAAPPNSVAVGALTHELTARVVDYEELPAVTAKGKTEPVLAWLAKAPVSRTGVEVSDESLTPFVGRDVELAYLKALFDKAATAAPQFVLIVGEPGIGKSRLVRELFTYVDSKPEMTTWREGRCLPYGEGVSFWALAEIVKAQAGILQTDDAPTVSAKLDAIVPDGADRAWVANRLRALLGLEAPQAEREENFTAWLRFVERLALEEPLVVVLEDLHWADDGLLAFVEHLATHVDAVPLLVVGTARPELFERHATFAAGNAQVNRISLDRLTPQDTHSLVAGLLGDSDNLSRKIADVVDRSEGNPFFAEESARLLTDQVRGAPVPASVQAVIAARLDGLPAEQKAIVADAAVVGEVFWDGAVAALGHCERDVVDASLRDLVGKRLIRRVRESSMAGEGEFAYAHVLARDVAYAALPRRARAEKHAQAAAWLEGRASGRLEDVAELLAHHFLTAFELAQAVGDAGLAERFREPAVTALRLAGERAVRLDIEAAESLFARAAGVCAEDDSQRPALFEAWGRSLLMRDRLEEARTALEESARCFLAGGRKNEAAIAMTVLQSALFHLGGDWRMVLDKALLLTADEPDGEARARVMTAIARSRIATGDFTGGLDWIKQAVGVYRRRGSNVPLSLKSWQAQAEGGLGDRSAGDRLLSVARAMRDEGVGRDAAIAYLNYCAVMYPFDGPRVYDIALEGLDSLRSRGISEGQGLDMVNRCYGLISAGCWDEAQRSMDESLTWLQQQDDQLALCFWWANRAELLTLLGQSVEALECAREADERIQQWNDPMMCVLGRAILIAALASAGDEVRAIEVLGGFAQVPRRAGFQDYEELLPQLMRFALGCREIGLAEQLIADIEPELPLLEHVLVTGQALLLEARGESEAAAAGFADAAARWHEFGVPYERAQAQLGQGRCLVALGRVPEAAASLAAAHEIFARLGARPALTETDELMQQVASA